ncbi:MAG TPA: zinc ABC transporter substrate-binding protein [Phycisphaerae bacterium]|nr:zinc ABC transporter substrate-binding protein [Phycisphaerae bacterium]
MKRSLECWLAAVLSLALGHSRAPAGEAAGNAFEVFVSIPPQAYLVERIGGPYVTVHVLVQPGQEPHTFEPTPRQVMALGRVKLFLAIGLPFETRLLAKIRSAQQKLSVADTTEGITKRKMASSHHLSHTQPSEHTPQADDHRPAADAVADDPHVWLSPPLLLTMARNVARALQQTDPGNTAVYEQNLAALTKDIQATHQQVHDVLAAYRGQSFYVFHPAFGYFGDAYGLNQEAVEIGGKSPTPRQLARLVAKARADNVKIIFVQPQFDTKNAEAVAKAIGGAVVPMDPLARDVLGNFSQMATKIKAALTP